MAITPTRTAAAAGAVVLLALAGCDFAAQNRLDFSDTEKVKITDIEIVAEGSGDIAVRTSAIDEVRINRIVRYRGDEPGRTYRVEGTRLYLDTSCGVTCSVSYDIEAPAGVRLRGDHGSGDITLTNVAAVDLRLGSGSITLAGGSGTVTAETGSGDITATDVRGVVKLTTGSGTIEGRGLGGQLITAETGSGDISLTLDQAGPVRAHTSSGDATVLVPAGSYRVRTGTDSGDETVGISHDPAAKHLLDVTTDSGDVTLSAR